MKKLFTLVALLACFLGAKAEWVDDYSINYSTKTNFPFYVMGYVPEWVDGVMTDYGANYRYETQANLDGDGDSKWKEGESSVGTAMAGNTEYQKVTGAGPYWHQYIIASDVPMELDMTYTVKAVIKSSADVEANLQFGNWGSLVETKVNIPAGDFQEVEWEVTGCLFAGNGFICIQPGTSTATIEWKSLTVSHNAKPQAPTVWQEWLTNDGKSIIPEVPTESIYMGNAETPWADPNTKFDDKTKNYLICAWSKEKGRNLNEDQGWDPFPADIEVDPKDPNNHVFVCHGQPATTEGDPSAWDNQFWIQSPKSWKEGEKVKIHFRYMCNKPSVTTQTQIHNQNPSDYLIWHAINDVTFTDQWQTFDGEMTIAADMAGGWSIAFNLNPNDKDAINFYFDDLQWMSMVLDEGFFVAGSNSQAGLDYDFANAIPFELVDGTDAIYFATVGEAGKKDTYVSEIMISTVRGNDASFKANTLKPNGTIASDLDTWLDYAPASVAKLKLPMAGVWNIYIDTDYKSMAFECVEGEAIVYDDEKIKMILLVKM